jgi:hypothetical protein
MGEPTPKQIAYRASFVTSLNDPEIGGMFENGGAVWVLDESIKGFFMTYEFPVETTTNRQLSAKIDELIAISSPWVVDWWVQVADIKDGVMPKPTRRITRADRRWYMCKILFPTLRKHPRTSDATLQLTASLLHELRRVFCIPIAHVESKHSLNLHSYAIALKPLDGNN